MDCLENYLNTHDSNLFHSGYEKFGDYTLPSNFKVNQQRLYDFNIRDKDVWLVSFPKSGTTWAQEMIWMVLNDLNYQEALRKSIFDRFPFIDFSTLYNFDHFKSLNLGEEFEIECHRSVADSFKFIEDLYETNNSIAIKTHFPWELLPKQIQEGTKTAKIVYLLRNVKDVTVSFYHHFLKRGYTGTFEMFCELMLVGKIPYTPYWSHVKAFWERRHEPNILFLTYEEMKADLPAVIKNVALFLGKNLTTEDIKKLADHLSFSNMKNNASLNYEIMPVRFKNERKSESHLRKGIVGSYKETMSPKMIKRFDEWIKTNGQEVTCCREWC